MATLEEDMTDAARDLLGDGYHRDFYRNAASEFIQIAESHAARAVEKAKSARKTKSVRNADKDKVEKAEAAIKSTVASLRSTVAALKELIPAASP